MILFLYYRAEERAENARILREREEIARKEQKEIMQELRATDKTAQAGSMLAHENAKINAAGSPPKFVGGILLIV